MEKILTITVPSYNAENYLLETIPTMLSISNLEKLEIIIVNDGSTDKSKEIAQRYENKYSNVVLIDQKNKGLGGARNTGIEAVKGEYILFVDSDDYIHPDTLKLAYDEANKKQADIVVF